MLNIIHDFQGKGKMKLIILIFTVLIQVNGQEFVGVGVYDPIIYEPGQIQYMSDFPDYVKKCQENFIFSANVAEGKVLVTSKENFVYNVKIIVEVSAHGELSRIVLPLKGPLSSLFPGGTMIFNDISIKEGDKIKVISVECVIK